MTRSTRNPDFIICGAPRAGTTWLVEALERHPGIHMAKPIVPEPKFFHVDDLYAKGMQYYRDTFFANIPENVVAGEKDTYYLENRDTPGRIHAHLPDVKLIFILREPGVRAWSNYLWSKMHGHETKSFTKALLLEEERERNLPEELRFVRPHAYASRGLYADQLQQYVDLFPKENLCVLNFNDIVLKPSELIAKVHEFIGVGIRPQDGESLGVINMAKGEDAHMTRQDRQWLDEFFDAPNARLGQMLGPNFKLWSEPL